MSARVMLGMMVVGSALVVYLGSRGSHDPEPAPPPPKPTETPWLTPAAAAQIVGADGMPGPLFRGIELGGPVPSPDAQARIAAFARANNVDVRLEIAGDTLVAIRFDVSYGGCCGYEGADALGNRLHRPKVYDCLDCRFSGWLDDWTHVSEDARQFLRASIRVNRVRVRWERTITAAELVERAERLLDQDVETAGKAAGDRWHELAFEHTYLLEVAYPFDPNMDGGPSGIPFADRKDLGFHVQVERRKIREVSFDIRPSRDEESATLLAAMKKRWGPPRVDANGEITWRAAGRTITACCDTEIRQVTLRQGR